MNILRERLRECVFDIVNGVARGETARQPATDAILELFALSHEELYDYREFYESVVSGKAYINTESPEGLHFRELIGRIEDRRRK